MKRTNKIVEYVKNIRLSYNLNDGVHCLFTGLLYLLISLYLVSLANAFSDNLNESVQDYNKFNKKPFLLIKDFILDRSSIWVTKYKIDPYISDYFVNISVGLILLNVFKMKKTATIFRRVCFVISTAYIFRSATILLTILPNHQDCVVKEKDRLQNPFIGALLIMVQKRRACGDLFFSGHTILFTVLGLIYSTYPPIKNKIMNIIIQLVIWTFSLISMISLISTSFHYTIDVLTSFFIVSTIWIIYHFIVNNNNENDSWYVKLIIWYDGKKLIENSKDLSVDNTISIV